MQPLFLQEAAIFFVRYATAIGLKTMELSRIGFLVTAMASTSMLTTCMSSLVAVLMMRTLHFWIIIKCIIDKNFYRFICIS